MSKRKKRVQALNKAYQAGHCIEFKLPSKLWIWKYQLLAKLEKIKRGGKVK